MMLGAVLAYLATRVMPLVVAALLTHLAQFLPTLLAMALTRRVYHSMANYKVTSEALDALARIPRALRVGELVIGERTAPCVMLSTQAVAYCHVEFSMQGDTNTTVTVWTTGGPIVPDPKAPAKRAGMNFHELIHDSNCIEDGGFMRQEMLVAPPGRVPERVWADARTAADAIVGMVRDGSGYVFMLHGPSGVGKSLTAKMVAHLVDGNYYGGYDPSKLDNCIATMGCRWSEPGRPLVVAYEECDVSLLKIAQGSVPNSDKYVHDARDKASWNSMLDRLHSACNTVLVMTTNVPIHEVRDLCDKTDPSGSMLRPGRVDRHFVWDGRGLLDTPAHPASTAELASEPSTLSVSSVGVNDAADPDCF